MKKRKGSLNNFLKKRKQDDRVKIMLYLGIAAAVFLVLAAVDIARLARYISTPAEYILSCGTVTDAELKQLTDIDGVAAATPTADSTLTVKHRTAETEMIAACVSGDYARDVYGVERTGEMMTVFAGGAAYERLLSELGGNTNDPKLRSELIASYRDGDEYKPCRIVNIGQVAFSEALVFTVLPDSVLKEQATGVRAFVPKQDPEQTVVGRAQTLGFSVVSSEDILSFNSRIDRQFLELKYHLMIAAMCGVWIWTLRRFASDKRG